ncbi:M23 family metallopeptidase [Nocardiopsis tropica]|uniref:M23 family metallopeptidase n=1 Tax=Nocardiopsis tropica TaxID=109330 RepID=A0ABU7L0V0_9ACTN|nr:M23 family metallopeptidase [Nocardiopsis umidischolae]MEE2054507.1 M23 family metallopeptidase [Nocardiopsis umidischolae]
MRTAAGVCSLLFLWSGAVLLGVALARELLDLSGWWNLAALAAFGVLAALNLLFGRLARGGPPPRAVEVAPPVAGAWTALNSPADRVPSHGTRAYGQEYAIDVLKDSEGRPAFGWRPPVRGNRDFPAFGDPLPAVADAVVVRASDRRRDHLSRNSYPALAHLFVEGTVRSLGGAGPVIGNHVVLDLGDGVFALYAHVQRGSLRVREGDRVRAGRALALCGNSGNTTEPHPHFHLMDRADPNRARGVPFIWRGVGVPANGERFEVPGPARD